MIIQISGKLMQILLFLLAGFPVKSESQMLTTGVSSCEPNPYRRDNAYTKYPYDEIIYYKCYSVNDMYMPGKASIQERETCEYTKVIYYDTWIRSWTNAEMSRTCKVKYYGLNQKKDAILPEGWHPPLRIK